MNKAAIPLALTAAVLVAGCAYRATPAPAPVASTPIVVVPSPPPQVVQAPPPQVVQAPPTVVVPPPTAIRPGFGRVESVNTVATSSGSPSLRRIGIKMSDGTMQYVDTEAPNVSIGNRIELSPDGYLRVL